MAAPTSTELNFTEIAIRLFREILPDIKNAVRGQQQELRDNIAAVRDQQQEIHDSILAAQRNQNRILQELRYDGRCGIACIAYLLSSNSLFLQKLLYHLQQQ